MGRMLAASGLGERLAAAPPPTPDFVIDVLAAAADWVWETDPSLRIVRLSPTFGEGTGITPGDVVGRTLEELLRRFLIDDGEHQDQLHAVRALAPFRNLRLRLWDEARRRMRHFLLSGRPGFAPGGAFIGYRGVGLDVTEQAERDSRDGENRFRAIFDHAALGIAVVPPGGTLTHANPAMCAMFQYPPDELAERTFLDLVHPEDRQADAEAARGLVRGTVESFTRENRYRRKDGSLFWGRLTASLALGGRDGPFGVVTIEDIDDRRRAEENLSLFRRVMDASHEGVVILSPSGHILYANSAFARLFAVTQDGVAGTHYRGYFPRSSEALLDRALTPALLRGESWEGVIEAVDASGRIFPVWQRAGVLRDDSGKVRFFFAFMHDHSAQQTFEDELFDAKEAAEEANVAKTRFLAAASHDLRQPMQALAMFVEVLSGSDLDPARATLVGRVQDSVTALEGLLNGLLDVSKLEAGLVVPQADDFAIGPMMRRLAREFESLCVAEGIRLSAVPTGLAVHTDAALVERILRNLLNNAVRYTPAGGRVLFGCRRRGDVLRLEVWDSGIGIPQAELRNIFREFHQVGNSGRDRRQGLGLGLAIVERLARLLGHRIDVRSVEGRGSVFAVEVPVCHRRIAPGVRQLPLDLMRRGVSILVIEDEPDVRDGLEALLASWGHVVLAAGGADEAIRRLPGFGRLPDLIIADYRLQNGETGGQAIARIAIHLRAEGKVPAIIVTGDTAPERLQQAQALGHRLLHKPVRPDALRAAIEAALSGGSRPRKTPARKAKAS
ncbi:PAS domain S-box protein [Magnetospirillum sp. UT-4]|uniref:PAS domain S-box protein n=1 Tax=Magnetospirillum sp. UT-4 TaxID=2681467 RepID=UPI0013850377|nr:PAS domain S-box protein [Magnetospirillum sp. UT-4]CAA7616001.1 putative Histidine kinase [Magnetospirillum sp. UT-4]